jgi:chromosome partitioning protein
MASSLGSRAAFREAQIIGSTVHLVARAKSAVDEVETMADEVLSLLGLPRKRKGTSR